MFVFMFEFIIFLKKKKKIENLKFKNTNSILIPIKSWLSL